MYTKYLLDAKHAMLVFQGPELFVESTERRNGKKLRSK
jgi:hypothetical protein